MALDDGIATVRREAPKGKRLWEYCAESFIDNSRCNIYDPARPITSVSDGIVKEQPRWTVGPLEMRLLYAMLGEGYAARHTDELLIERLPDGFVEQDGGKFYTTRTSRGMRYEIVLPSEVTGHPGANGHQA